MAARKYDYNSYVQGSTARKLAYTEERRTYDVPERRRVEKQDRHVKSHPLQSFDVVSLFFMVIAVAVTLYVCVSYIQVQHNINTMSKKAAIMESEIYDLKNLNDAAYDKINTAVDLSYVYKVAVKELGMVRANQDQIMTYENVKSDFVRQYAQVPDEKGKILERTITKKK